MPLDAPIHNLFFVPGASQRLLTLQILTRPPLYHHLPHATEDFVLIDARP